MSDYFTLCLAAHWASVHSYVPTDVDAKIRGALWQDQQDADRVACIEALVSGCRKVPGQSGYDRALAGLHSALPGGLFDGRWPGECTAAVRRGLREHELRRLVAVPRISFESGLISRARNLLGPGARNRKTSHRS